MIHLSSQKYLFFLTGTLVAVCCLIIAAFSTAYFVYIRRDGSPVIRAMSRSLPVARIGSRRLTYGDFLFARDAAQSYLASEAAQQAGLRRSFGPDLEKSALDRLVREAAVIDIATQRRVKVTDADVRAAFANLVLATSSTLPNVAQYLSDTFHWTEEEYRRNILRPVLLEERLAAAMGSSTEAGFAALESSLRDRLAQPDVNVYLKF